MNEPEIAEVADTALWVATYRARETEREDAAFRDPLAGKLAGERGARFAASLGASEAMAFAMVVRTTAIDRLVELALTLGVDTVLNLGAGLDTRPYRMALPADLRWIEVDFPGLIAYKEALLADETPSCRLERVALDLSNDEARGAFLAQVGAEARRCLVITEGVVVYLTPEQAERLSKDLYAVPTVAYWIQDYSKGRFQKVGEKRLKRLLHKVPFRFDQRDPLAFFRQHGWTVFQDIGILDEAERIGRPFPALFPWSLLLKLLPGIVRALGNRTYSFVMLGKTSY